MEEFTKLASCGLARKVFREEMIKMSVILGSYGSCNILRNINDLRYTDDTTLMAETEEQLQSFLMKVIEEHARY